ncbi:glycosyltransferase [Mycetocola manganoxydans]|uniref:Glycosyltransferase n=1 Tax=Mycetocola manganoxydans TaxID=699879 RepID=A0A3L7A177_9MICO|nr:glycosyltransferase family 2 protein [Mycetocola manganoxydans]RLP73887.1 glycosyltransferase [Mycetocola manganoxydans]GHD42513.1 glycosyl transferase [Mycetocola manganoxydans]
MRSRQVVAVVVAYNRRDLLREVLAGLKAQTRVPDAVVVVDNASSDDSAAVVREVAPTATLIQLSANTGGAGGFAVGMAAALARHDPDWVWVMDDDTVPETGALDALLHSVDAYNGENLCAVGSRVVWTNGAEHPMNTPRRNPFAGKAEKSRAEDIDAVAVRSLSFVSSMYRADAIVRHGFPIADYFLWNDDFEFSARLLRHGAGLSVPASVVVHKTRAFASTDVDPGPRFRLEVRNKVWLFRASPALSPGEKVIYIGASFLRWGKTFRSSHDRRTLRSGLAVGLREGLARRPRPNSAVLAGVGVPEDVLAVLERRPS